MGFVRTILNLAIGEAIIFFSGRDILHAQDFDMPDVPQKRHLNEIDSVDQDLVIKQIFNNYEFNGYNYTDILHMHTAIPNTGKELKNLLMNEIPVEYMDAFNSVVDVKNRPVFDYWDIAKFYQNDISIINLSNALKKAKPQERSVLLKHLYKASYKAWKEEHKNVSKAFKNRANFRSLYSLSLIKRSQAYFKSSEKPNLLITYPSIDFNQALYSPAARRMIKDLSDTYNIFFSTLRNEKDLYKAINRVERIELLIITGHGKKNRIMLNEPDQHSEDNTYIDTNDKELKRYLKKLTPDALIFLNACNTGKGGKEIENLANNLAECADGRKVIASMEPFSIDEIIFRKKYPFDIDIPNKTYVAIKSR